MPDRDEPGPPDRVVAVAPERLAGWVTGFTGRHGATGVGADPGGVTLDAADGARARLLAPAPPLPDADDPLAALIAQAGAARTVGALLVRRGGWAVGLFRGPALQRSKVGRSYVQGQTKAGGWSQQRYARRRAQQADHLYAAAADAAADLLLPSLPDLAALVGGGDARGVDAVLADRRLAGLRPLLAERVLPTVDPRLRVLEEFGERMRAVRIELNALA